MDQAYDGLWVVPQFEFQQRGGKRIFDQVVVSYIISHIKMLARLRVQMRNRFLKAFFQNFEKSPMPNAHISTIIFLKLILLNELLRRNRLLVVKSCI